MALIIHNLHEIIIFSTGRMCATELHNWSSAIDLNCEKKYEQQKKLKQQVQVKIAVRQKSKSNIDLY